MEGWGSWVDVGVGEIMRREERIGGQVNDKRQFFCQNHPIPCEPCLSIEYLTVVCLCVCVAWGGVCVACDWHLASHQLDHFPQRWYGMSLEIWVYAQTHTQTHKRTRTPTHTQVKKINSGCSVTGKRLDKLATRQISQSLTDRTKHWFSLSSFSI